MRICVFRSWDLSFRSFALVSVALELSFGSFRFGTFTRDVREGSSLVNCAAGLSLGSWKLQHDNVRLGTLAWELSLGNVRLGTLAWQFSIETFRLGSKGCKPWLGNFRLETFGWKR